MTVILILFTGSDTSVAGIALRAPMRTGAGVCVCPVQYHAQTAGVTHAALPVSLVTSSMVTVAFCVYAAHIHLNDLRDLCCILQLYTLRIKGINHCSWQIME